MKKEKRKKQKRTESEIRMNPFEGRKDKEKERRNVPDAGNVSWTISFFRKKRKKKKKRKRKAGNQAKEGSRLCEEDDEENANSAENVKQGDGTDVENKGKEDADAPFSLTTMKAAKRGRQNSPLLKEGGRKRKSRRERLLYPFVSF